MLVVCIFASALGALVMCLLVLRDGFSPISADPARADHDVLITRLGHAVAGACFATTAILATVLVARNPAPVPVHQMTERIGALERERRALGEQVSGLATSMHGLQGRVDAATGDLQSMRLRLDQAESRFVKAENGLAKTEAGLSKVEAGLKRLSEEVAQANARARQQVERPVAVKPTAAPPRENVVPARPPQRRADAERPHESASQATAEAVSPPPATAPAPAPKAAAVAASAHKPAPSAAASAPQDLRDQSVTDKVRKDWATIRKGFSTAGDDISNALRRFGRD
ncbi:MAG: hypothetical protein DMD85_22435 [Candidatus Rokuibacteriota bacterium]|nr:MAG: hypothetical protein DMD85_22435 [Candidatus Rokubacteria bacterium]